MLLSSQPSPNKAKRVAQRTIYDGVFVGQESFSIHIFPPDFILVSGGSRCVPFHPPCLPVCSAAALQWQWGVRSWRQQILIGTITDDSMVCLWRTQGQCGQWVDASGRLEKFIRIMMSLLEKKPFSNLRHDQLPSRVVFKKEVRQFQSRKHACEEDTCCLCSLSKTPRKECGPVIFPHTWVPPAIPHFFELCWPLLRPPLTRPLQARTLGFLL